MATKRPRRRRRPTSGAATARTNTTFCPDTTSRCESPAPSKSSATTVDPPRSSPRTNPVNNARRSGGSDVEPSTTSRADAVGELHEGRALVDRHHPLGHHSAPHVAGCGPVIAVHRLDRSRDLHPLPRLPGAEPTSGAASRHHLEATATRCERRPPNPRRMVPGRPPAPRCRGTAPSRGGANPAQAWWLRAAARSPTARAKGRARSPDHGEPHRRQGHHDGHVERGEGASEGDRTRGARLPRRDSGPRRHSAAPRRHLTRPPPGRGGPRASPARSLARRGARRPT